jgi:peptide-methionine (S)-S-oxide reductase
MADASIVMGGGCFWCVEAVFECLKGVKKVVSGYAGGTNEKPTYDQVCSGRTGHAEVIRVDYDPQVLSLDRLLDVFLAVHDPTTLNRQGADVGTQYRSVVYYVTEAEKATIEKAIERTTAEKVWPGRIVTEVSPLPTFYSAEEYHQGYFRNHPNQPYCLFVAAPKVEKLFKKFPELVAPAS